MSRPGPILSDGVVRLRPWTVDDAGWYAREVADPLVQRFTTEPATLTTADVVRAIEAIDAVRVLAVLIADAVSGVRLGNLAVTVDDGVGDVSYWVAASARGRGVAGAALRLVADHLLASGRVTELRLWTHADNVASQRAAVAAGFERDAARDAHREVKGETWPTVAYRRAG